jgi:predicted RNA binding protein YcfA (HicA-like mRNA interferase family)
MKRLSVVSGNRVVRALQRKGFLVVHQRGSHVKLKKTEGDKIYIAIVPMHRELAKGTLKSILRQAGLTLEELHELL